MHILLLPNREGSTDTRPRMDARSGLAIDLVAETTLRL